MTAKPAIPLVGNKGGEASLNTALIFVPSVEVKAYKICGPFVSLVLLLIAKPAKAWTFVFTVSLSDKSGTVPNPPAVELV